MLPVEANDHPKKTKHTEGGEDNNLENSNVPTKENDVKIANKDFLQFYGQNEDTQSKQLGEIIQTSFMNQFPGSLKPEQIHNYYLCKQRKCNDICKSDKEKMSKDNKFQHKWLNDPNIARCKATGIWSLCYIDTKGMFCAMCRLHNVDQPTNHSKVWNTEANTRCRTETVRGHLKDDDKDMHGEAVKREALKQKSYFTVKKMKQIKF